MISEKMNGWLNEHYGNLRDWKKYLQDFTDDQIKSTIRENLISSGGELLKQLRLQTDPGDEERRAHLLGFEDAAQRTDLRDRIKDLQEKCHDPGC